MTDSTRHREPRDDDPAEQVEEDQESLADGSVGAVLDTSVLFPAALRDTLLRAAARRLYRLFWSEEILEELRRNLVTDRLIPEHRARRLVEQRRALRPSSVVAPPAEVVDRMTNHPKDRHVLAVAVAAEARMIVTANLRHFAPEVLEPLGLVAKSPDRFLLDLAALHPTTMDEIIAEQVAALRAPPMTLEEVVARIALDAPHFAEVARRRLRGES